MLSSILSDASPQPSVVSAIPAGDVQLAVKFNMNNVNELITNGRWESGRPTNWPCLCLQPAGLHS